MPKDAKPKPQAGQRQHQDWVTSFDRDLIRAAVEKTPISFETVDYEEEIAGGIVIQVDKEFIKVRINGEDVWFNKEHICKLRISHAV